jgi:hypothetical protein
MMKVRVIMSRKRAIVMRVEVVDVMRTICKIYSQG